jgi:hypothetical protein
MVTVGPAMLHRTFFISAQSFSHSARAHQLRTMLDVFLSAQVIRQPCIVIHSTASHASIQPQTKIRYQRFTSTIGSSRLARPQIWAHELLLLDVSAPNVAFIFPKGVVSTVSWLCASTKNVVINLATMSQ